MNLRPKGKSRMNEMIREQFKAMGLEPCKLCGVPGKWDVFHTPEHPCEKQPTPNTGRTELDAAAVR